MKKKLMKLFIFALLLSFLLQFGGVAAKADVSNTFTYVDETFKVTYIIVGEWKNDVVNVNIEIENIGNEVIKNWFLGMSIDGEIDDIWNAVIYKHIEDHYIIKNANYNSDIAPGEKINFGCIIKFQGKVSFPKEFYMPAKTVAVSQKRYEVSAEVVSAWDSGYKFQISIKNNSKQTIEDWTMEFDLAGKIHSFWDGVIVSEDNSHYLITNNKYNSSIASGESVSFGFIVDSSSQIYLENIVLNEVTFDGIKTAEKLVDPKNFEMFNIVTDEYRVTPLYTIDGRISAYLVQYYRDEIPTGYIVVSNEVGCMDYYIEFGLGVSGMLNKMVELVETKLGEDVERIVYAGGYRYYVLVDDIVYVLDNLELKMLTDEEEQQLFLSTSEPQYYDKGVTLALSDIYAKEVGYSSVQSGESPYVPDFVMFKTMTETKEAYLKREGKIITNHCGPTAALNMLYYWDNRGYTPLSLDGSNWETAFCTLYSGMKTDNDKGTYDTDMEAALKDIFSGYKTTYMEYIYSVSWEIAKNYLNRGAVILSLQDSQIYGNHAVLGIGHYTFSFSSGWNSRYFKIVDGWEGSEEKGTGPRYVNYSLGIDHTNALVVELQR